MSLYVVDASVAAKWFLHEEHTQAARRVLAGDNDFHAPDFFLLEMDNVLCKHVRRGNISGEDAHRIRAALGRCPIHYHSWQELRNSAYAMANQTRRSVYDCLYVALAAELGGQMVTADRRLYEALTAGPLSDHVVWVEDAA